MIISVPVKTESVYTNVVDPTELFSTTVQKTWEKNDEVKFTDPDDEDNIEKIYIALDTITVLTYDPTKPDYELGDVVWGEGTAPNQVMYSTVGTVPKHPADYPIEFDFYQGNWLTGQRYIRITPDGESLTPTTTYVRSVVYPDDYTHTYTFIKQANDSMYVRLEVFYPVAEGGTLAEYTDGTVPIVTSISSLTDEPPTIAVLQDVVGTSFHSWFPQFFFQDSRGTFFRSDNLDAQAPQELINVTDAMLFKPITKPTDIPNFVEIRVGLVNAPFDGKNFTKTSREETMTYMVNSDEICNMFVLGYVKGDYFKYQIGNEELSDPIIIDSSRDEQGVLSDWYTTKIIYFPNENPLDLTPRVIPAGTNITIIISNNIPTNGELVELGSLMLGAAADAGMTNLTLKNGYKDFSVFEYDPWGNPSYTDRAKVSVYSGTVDVLIESYDRMDRLMTSLGKNVVIVDGSDNTSNVIVEDTPNVFASTQKIGRFMSFSQQTTVSQDMIDVIANYSFTLEEIV